MANRSLARHLSRSRSGAVVLLAVVGCSALVEYEPPTVSMVGIRFMDARLEQQRFRITMQIHNPNDINLPVQSIHYRIRLVDSDFAHGQTSKAFTIPARGEATVEATLYTDLLGSLANMLAWAGTAPAVLEYEIHGKIKTGVPLFGNIGFSDKGEVPLRE